jgi:uncharacterized protein (TIGR03435 family)
MLRCPAVALIFAALATAADSPTFEVASIRPASRNAAAATDIKRDPAGGILLANVNLRTLVMMAYNLQPFQLSGGPSWLRPKRFDVAAKAPANARKDQTWVMLQALLADRFKLVVHKETKELPIFELVVAKGGPKIQPAHREPSVADDFIQTHSGRMKALMVPMSDFALVLSSTLGRRVVDKTNLEGKFDFQLEFAPEKETDSDRPSIFTALQDQLGLKLEASRGPVEILVIDSAELPSEN